ncbi:autotransporter domain-containing protein [Pseudomonas sp. PB120]|uniref:autotransporter outer membrane beta-barrel domain-containing protein n=1 Tax=Pseudomonas sp. PB120 TaxID=2494700 RepID=UPI0012FE758E|nr:autotransporter outer membrane beta-barrel domain-containing protein [Pseudomonas sp. PB120]MVV47463.1 autotransporter domain-containing protein [Pseudomonas sp. PB120]
MSVKHKNRPHHLALAIALALGCAEFTTAQSLPAPTEPAGSADITEPVAQPEIHPFDRFTAFLNASDTVPKVINKPQTAVKGKGVNDLIVVKNGGSIKGQADGGGGTNFIHLDASDGGTLELTRNFDGLYISQGEWTLTSTGDFKEVGVGVLSGATLTNNGIIEGGAIAAGKFFNYGDIKGHVTVEDGGVFAGSGTVGGLEVHGLLYVDRTHGAPSVKGDLTLHETAILAYEVAPDGRGETIKVEGTAKLGNATLKLVTSTIGYPQSTRYTVIEADRIEGEFSRVENDLAYMEYELHYEDPNAVGLTFTRNGLPFEKFATDGNSRELARSLENVNSTNAAITALLGTNTTTAPYALEILSGDSNANLARATLNSDGPVSETMLSAMRQLDSTAGSSHQKNAPRVAAGNESDGRVWVQALGHSGKLDREFDTLQHSTQGLVLGADWRVDEQWRIGVMGGQSRTRQNSNELDGDLDSWHLGAYALRQDGPMSLRMGATYNSHDGTSKRRVDFYGFSDRPKGQYDANTQQVFAEAGYNLGRGNVSIEPFASLGYQRYQRDNFTEKGGAAALNVHSQTEENLSSTFGLRLAKLNTLENGLRLTPRFSAGWKHNYGEVYTETRQRLVTGGKDFSVYSAPLDRNSLKVDAGLDLGLSAHHTLGVGVTGEMGTDSRTHGVMGQWRMSF